MLHIIEGINLAGIAICLVLIATVLPVKLRYLITAYSRYACSIFFIALAAYVTWVAQLFFRDSFGTINYSFALIGVRAVALLTGIWFLIAVIRCNGSMYAARRPSEDDHPRRRSTD